MKRIMRITILALLISMFTSLPTQAKTTIEVGDYVLLGKYHNKPILWRCIDIDENGPLMLSDKVLSFKAFDYPGKDTSGSHGRIIYRKEYGSNYWEDSNIRSWLNSREPAKNVTWLCGNMPYMSHATWYGYEEGFLSSKNFTEDETKVINTVTQKSLVSGYEYSKDIDPDYHKYSTNYMQNYETACSEQILDTIFLLDVKQFDRILENKNILGDLYYQGKLTQDAVDNSGYITSNISEGKNWNYWLRTPNAEDQKGSDVLYAGVKIGFGGLIHSSQPNEYSIGCRPAFYLKSDDFDAYGYGTIAAPYKLKTISDPDTIDQVTLSSYKSSPRISGETITFNAYAQGTSKNPVYRFSVNGDVVQEYSDSAEFVWSPVKAGYYTISVEAKDVYEEETTANNKLGFTIMEELSKDHIKIGEYLIMGEYYGDPILWRCVDIDENGPLLLSDKIISIKPFDAITTDDYTKSHGRGLVESSYIISRKKVGSNYWGDSNMRSWLNSDMNSKGVVWLCGNPPTADKLSHPAYPGGNGYNAYADEMGFMKNFQNDELRAIKPVNQKSLLSRYEYNQEGNDDYHKYQCNISSVLLNYESAYSEQVKDTIFLPDIKQVYRVYENSDILGYEYYIGEPTSKSSTNSKAMAPQLGKKWNYWLRSPLAMGTQNSYVRYVHHSGRIEATYADNDEIGIRPAFYLYPVSFTYGNGTVDEPYKITGTNPLPKYKLGDANGDGEITSTDYTIMRRYILDIDITSYIPKDLQINEVIDLNFDKSIDSTDLMIMKRHLLNIKSIHE